MPETTTDYAKYLDPKVLARITALDLRARMIVEGCISGMHRSPNQGYSVEFADHREYTQSDDIKHIDWKVFGRTNKYYIKEYVQESNLELILAVDCSESMSYQSQPDGLSKHDYAISIAASLSYLALQQQDSVGLVLFDTGITEHLKPSNNPLQWKTIIHELEGSTGPAKTSLKTVLDDLAERIHRRSLVVLISDLFDDPTQVLGGLKHLRYRKNEIIVCQVMDPDELTFPFHGPTLFEGMEGSGTLLAEPRTLQKRYLEQVEQFVATLKRGCRNMRIDWELYNTSTPLYQALSTYLARRSAGIK